VTTAAIAAPFSLAQLLGYVAFCLGVTAFWQSDDRRLKALVAALSLTYAAHFTLLGNPTAVASALISSVRAGLSIYTRSIWIAAAVVIANLIAGFAMVSHWQQVLPIAGAVLGTIAMFLLRGIAMRLVLLMGTCLWLTNNLLSGSIGGSALELIVGLTNATTIVRMLLASRRKAAVTART
jgi:hypothetical protein